MFCGVRLYCSVFAFWQILLYICLHKKIKLMKRKKKRSSGSPHMNKKLQHFLFYIWHVQKTFTDILIGKRTCILSKILLLNMMFRPRHSDEENPSPLEKKKTCRKKINSVFEWFFGFLLGLQKFLEKGQGNPVRNVGTIKTRVLVLRES